MAADGRDRIWVRHRPRTVPDADRAKAAPPLLDFDADGKFLRRWGGPGDGFVGSPRARGFNEGTVKRTLEQRGYTARRDEDSGFHVKDLDGANVQLV